MNYVIKMLQKQKIELKKAICWHRTCMERGLHIETSKQQIINKEAQIKEIDAVFELIKKETTDGFGD